MLTFLAVANLLPHRATAVVIEHVSVIEPGQSVARKDCTVVIENGLFSQVGDSGTVTVPSGAFKIDGHDKFLIPGLWDMHVHLDDEKELSLFTANGVTGVRVMFGAPEFLAWRDRTAKGTLLGPRMKVGSPIVDGARPMWGAASIAMRPGDDAKALVSKLKSEKWDFIKVYSYLSRTAYLNLAAEANKQGMPFEGHVPMTINPLEAARLGQKSMEHLDGFPDAGEVDEPLMRKELQDLLANYDPPSVLMDFYRNSRKKYNRNVDKKRTADLLAGLGASEMWQCPTLAVLRALSSLDDPKFLDDPRLKYMPEGTRDFWNPANDFRLKARTKAEWDFWRQDYLKKKAFVMPLKRTGSRFIAGSDCLNPYVFPGFGLHDELALLVEADFTPTEALAAATINAARFFGEESKWGTIRQGKRADAVLLDRDPLLDIHNTTSISSVIQGGKVFDRKDLDDILKSNIGRKQSQ